MTLSSDMKASTHHIEVCFAVPSNTWYFSPFFIAEPSESHPGIELCTPVWLLKNIRSIQMIDNSIDITCIIILILFKK